MGGGAGLGLDRGGISKYLGPTQAYIYSLSRIAIPRIVLHFARYMVLREYVQNQRERRAKPAKPGQRPPSARAPRPKPAWDVRHSLHNLFDIVTTQYLFSSIYSSVSFASCPLPHLRLSPSLPSATAPRTLSPSPRRPRRTPSRT